MTVGRDLSLPSFAERLAASQAQLIAVVKKAEKELVMSLAEKLQKLNTLSKNSPFAYRLVELPSGPTCHMYQNDRFVRMLTPSAVDRRLRDAITASRLASAKTEESSGRLNPEEVRRRRAEMRQALLATLNLSTKLKEQLVVLQGHQMFSPFVVE